MLDFELIYVTAGGKGRVVSTVTIPAIFLLSMRGEDIPLLWFVSERAEEASACALPKTHRQVTK